MGCDIHAYIDYDIVRKVGTIYTSNFCKVRLGRNYSLFALMAGVRYSEVEMDGASPLFAPRGVPEQYSVFVLMDYGLYVNDELSETETFCSLKDAENWVNQGYSVWLNAKHGMVSNPDYHSASWLTAAELERVQETYANIKMSDSSWYQAKEQIVPEGARVVRANTSPWANSNNCDFNYIEAGERKPVGRNLNLAAIIAAMKVLDGDIPGKSRLVFWFDN